jgi:DNA-3-methyladenine glycosylase
MGFTKFAIATWYMKLTRDFYQREDVVAIARELLGKVIFTNINGFTAGLITETEAYAGAIDKASHAWASRRTSRTETMFMRGGTAYVYLCYGVHHLFNFVTNLEGIPHAVLLRGILPLEGIKLMEERTGKRFKQKNFTDGPGKLTRALAIQTIHDGTDLLGNKIWVEDAGVVVPTDAVLIGPRIGVDYAGEDALLPYRFLIRSPEGIKKPPPVWERF